MSVHTVSSHWKTPACLRFPRALALLLGLSLSVSANTALAQTQPVNPPAPTPPATPATPNFQGGTLGIDCEKPRRNPEGKLILNDDGTHRARCEADRVTALNYAAVVRQTRDRLKLAFQALPPPLWDDLVTHLRTNDIIGDWSYRNATVIRQLSQLQRNEQNRLRQAGEQPDFRRGARADTAHDLAVWWQAGVLQRTRYPADWRTVVRARACGGMVMVWLDPDNLRDRWSPEMVQRTVRAWTERKTDRFVSISQIPAVLTASGQLQDARGNTRDISRNQATRDCFIAGANRIPTGALVMRASMRPKIDTGRSTMRCTNPDQVGYRSLGWERRNGVFVVPENALDANGNAHPQRGQPLLAPFAAAKDRPIGNPASWPVVNEAGATFLLGSTCRAPRVTSFLEAKDCPAFIAGQNVTGKFVREYRFREFQNDPDDPLLITMRPVNPSSRPIRPNDLGVTVPAGEQPQHWEETSIGCTPEGIPDSDAPTIPPRVPDDWGYPDCEGQHGVRFRYGTRQGYIQTLTYPPGWPKKDVEVRTIDDDCWGPNSDYGTLSRPGPACPAGWSGEIIEGRDFRWWDRGWAVRDGVYPRFGRPATLPDDASAGHAGATWDAGNTGQGSFNRVTRTRDWHVDKNSCTRPMRVSDTQTRAGPSCPRGQIGSIREARSFSWYNRDHGATPPFAIPNRSVGQAAASYDGNPSQAGLAWYERVSLTSGWRRVSNTCRRPPPPPRDTGRSGRSGNGGERENREDNDRDGVNDYFDQDDGDPNVGAWSGGNDNSGGNDPGESSGGGGWGGGGSSGGNRGEDR